MNTMLQSLLILSAFVACCCGAEVVTSVRGQLLDENGMAPLANQDVFSDANGTKVARTDSAGYFDYPVKEGQTRIHVLPWSREIVGRSVFIEVSEFTNSTFKIVVERGVTLMVKVVAKDGSPISGAKVSWVGSGGASGESDDSGIARVGRISRFKNGNIVVRVNGCQEVVKADMCATTYADREVVMVVADYLVPVPAKPESGF